MLFTGHIIQQLEITIVCNARDIILHLKNLEDVYEWEGRIDYSTYMYYK